MSDISWDNLATCLAVVESGSLSAAARRLRLSQPTVRRQIEQLEASLGQRLFTRSPAGLLPTEAALRAVAPLREMDAAARAFTRIGTADPAQPKGTVRITASEVFASQILPAVVTGIIDRLPLVTIELVGTDVVDDLLLREADIAVRMTRPTQAGLIARRLARVELGFHASRAYLDANGTPASVEALVSTHRLVTEDRTTAIRDGLRAAGLDLSGMQVALKTDHNVVQLEAIRQGAGIGICLAAVAARDTSLVRLLPALSAHLEVWLAIHEDLRHYAPIRDVHDALLADLPKALRVPDQR